MIQLIYLYCVAKAKPNRSNFKDMGIKIYPIYSQGTYAIVSKVSPDEFKEDNLKKKLADMKWVEKKALQHEKVIEEIMQDAPVIPFKFATVFNTEENVERLLKEHSTEFKKIISDLEGKEEWGLKIYCDLEKFKNILNEDAKIKEREQEIASAGKGKAYFLKKKRDELINNILNEKIAESSQDCFNQLKGQSVGAKINKLLPKEVTQKKEKMILNAAFLIIRRRIKEFDDILASLKTKYAQKGLEFNWTGPWPPYNFCSIDKKG